MGTKIRVGVVGAGWGAGLQLAAFRAAGAELAGIFSRTRERAEHTAERFGVAHVADSLDELIELDVDVVSIASPPSAHLEQTVAAVTAGRHVLCDKPVAMTAEDARRMLWAAEEAGVRHATGFIWRGDPALGRMRELINAGAVGQVVEVHSSCALGAPPMPMNWMHLVEAGGGALMQHGSHVLDRLRWLMNAEVSGVFGRLAHDVEDASVDGEFHHTLDVFGWSATRGGPAAASLPKARVTADSGYDFLAELTNGVRARVWEATHLAGPVDDQILVIGEEATLAWSSEGLYRHRPRQEPELMPTPRPSSSGSATPHEVGIARWTHLAHQFLSTWDGHPAVHPTLADGWQVARITDAIHRSHRSRSWEKV